MTTGNNDKMSDVAIEDVIKMIPGHIYWKDLDGRFLGCNEQQAKTFGLSSSAEVIGKTDYDFFPKKEADYIRSIDQQVINSKSQMTVEEPVMQADGKTVYYLSKKKPLFDKAGKIIGIVGSTFDLTHERREQNTLVEQKKRTEITLEKIISLLPGHVYWKDAQGIFLGCNVMQAKSVGLDFSQ